MRNGPSAAAYLSWDACSLGEALSFNSMTCKAALWDGFCFLIVIINIILINVQGFPTCFSGRFLYFVLLILRDAFASLHSWDMGVD